MKLLYTLCMTMFWLCIQNGYAQTNDCFTANPFCSSNQYNFPNATSGSAPNGPNYGCLFSQPAPIWYYMEIDTPGTIQITLQQTSQPNGQGAQYDVDFALWGPFSNLNAGCQSIMSGNLPPLQCSFSASYTETLGIGMPGGYGSGASVPPSAQTGQVYIVILTNYRAQTYGAAAAGYISFNQTGGTGSADCEIVEPCSITNFVANITACNPETGNYSVNGTIDINNPPSTGQLVVENCMGVQQVVASAPFNATTYNYTLAGLAANGQACDIEVYFTANDNCNSSINYTAPVCEVCTIVDINSSTSCQTNGTYTINGTIDFSLPPSTGTLVVTTSSGGSQTFNAPFTSPLAFSMSGLVANGSSTTISATFSDITTCTLTETFTAPNAVTPTFNPISLCVGETPPTLSNSSLNGVLGTWTPPVLDAASPGFNNYDFIPNAGQCATIAILTVPTHENPTVSINQAGVLYECLVAPTVNLGGTSTTPNVSYEWSGNGIVSGGNTPNVVVGATGPYTLTVTSDNTGCSNSASVTVVGDENVPNIEIATPIVISCTDPIVTLNATSSTPGITFDWVQNPGFVNGTSTMNPTVDVAGVYQINVLNPLNGCTNSAAVTVVGDTLAPELSLSTNNLVISCDNPTVTMYAVAIQAGATYQWTGPGIVSNTTSSTISANSAGTYTVTVTNPVNNCSSTATFIVTGNTDAPTVAITNNPVIDCNNPEVQITANASANTAVSWDGLGVVSGGTTLNPIVSVQGVYTVTVTNTVNNCMALASVNVGQIFPLIPAIFEDTMVCGSVFEIPLNSVVGNGTITWSEVSSNGTFSNVNSTTAVFTGISGVTQYELLFIDECGYNLSAKVFMIPPTKITAPPVSCNLNEAQILVNSYSGGTWSVIENPATAFMEDTTLTFISSSQIYGVNDTSAVVVKEPGTYQLFFDNEGICPDTIITLFFPPYIYTQVLDTTLCLGVVHELHALESNYPVSYLWSNGSTGTSITVTQPGNYSVQITSDCYTYSDTATIVYEFCDIDAPNVISLSSKEGNNFWFVQSKGVTDFHCVIVNRWGHVIYEYDDVNGKWNGRDKGDNLVSEGVYFYHIKARIADVNDVQKQGFITVVH